MLDAGFWMLDSERGQALTWPVCGVGESDDQAAFFCFKWERSIKSVKSNIVEGYGRRRYKQEYIRFLTFALASCDETTDHLETLYETGSLKDEALYKNLHQRLQTLGKKINRFIQSVEKEHRTDV